MRTHDDFMNWNPGEDSVLAEQAGISQAMRRHKQRELQGDSRRQSWKISLAIAVALAVALAMRVAL